MSDLMSTTALSPVYYDNTRITDFKECPRKFYFRHIRHIVPEGTAPPLVFGISWHEAMDAVWVAAQDDHKDNNEVVKAGLEAFTTEWKKWGYPLPNEVDEEWDGELKFRTIDTALEMIYQYVQQYRSRIQLEYNLIAIEQPFAVPLYEGESGVWYVGRLDKVLEHRDQFWIYEHKTSSLYAKASFFRKEFIESFDPNSQVDGYMHAGHMFWPDKKFTGIMIDAALVHANVHNGFKLIPVMKRNAMLEEWLAETRGWIADIEANKEILQFFLAGKTSNTGRVPFPRNTNNCMGKYGACPYHGICKFKPDPFTTDEFAGYRTEKWEPFSILKLAKIGLKEEN